MFLKRLILGGGIALVAVAATSGCGQKGPLVLPPAAVPASAPGAAR
ncbi:lipoprotein [Tibeticola sp.]|nr:lipoprotein [Tibeticola sp.]